MNLWFLVIIWSIFNLDAVHPKCFTSKKPRTLMLRCSKGSVIYGPNVTQTFSMGRGQHKCAALSAQTLVQENECFWKTGCEIVHDPAYVMVKSLTDNRDCLGHTTGTTCVSSYKCIREASVFTLNRHQSFGKITNGGLHIESTHANQGIIRSHVIYPWNYNHNHNGGHHWERRLYVKATEVLLLEVDDIQIHSRTDSLTIEFHRENKDSEVKVQNTFEPGNVLNFPNSGYVIVNFTTGRGSNFGRGFIICFKFATKTEQLLSKLESGSATNRVCDDVTKTKIGCKSKRRNGKKKNRKGKKKGSRSRKSRGRKKS